MDCFSRRGRKLSGIARRCAAKGFCWIAAAGLLLAGCEQQQPITQNTTPKPHVLEKSVGEDRMLAAIVPSGDQWWFFKLAGPREAVGEQEEEFRTFLTSITFPSAQKPQWELPEGWRETGETSSMRYATIEAGEGEEALELSVIALPAGQGLLANVNRWRRQMSLASIPAAQLEHYTEDLELPSGEAILVDLYGTQQDGGMSAPFAGGAAPFAGGGQAPFAGSGAGETAPPARSPARPAQPKLTYDVPQGWTEVESGIGGLPAFEVSDGGGRAVVQALVLPGDRATALQVINIWRSLFELEPWTDAEVEQSSESIEIDQASGRLIELTGSAGDDTPSALVGAAVSHGSGLWAFSIRGDRELVERETENFNAFLDSVRFESSTKEAGDGE